MTKFKIKIKHVLLSFYWLVNLFLQKHKSRIRNIFRIDCSKSMIVNIFWIIVFLLFLIPLNIWLIGMLIKLGDYANVFHYLAYPIIVNILMWYVWYKFIKLTKKFIIQFIVMSWFLFISPWVIETALNNFDRLQFCLCRTWIIDIVCREESKSCIEKNSLCKNPSENICKIF